MNLELFKTIEKSLEKMQSSEPTWVKRREEPEYKVSIHGDSGPTMLLLHGLFGAMSNWDGVLPLFAKFTKSHALSFPLLTAPRADVGVKTLAAYVEYYIRSRNLGKVILCGNSLGGHVAMRLCLAAPELVDCLVLAGPSGLYEHTVDSLPIRPDSKFIQDHMGRVFYNPKFNTPEATQEILGIISKRANHLNLIQAARTAKKDNLLKYLKDIHVPTLLLWGEEDEVTTMDVARIFNQNIPNSELVSRSQCGHAPMIEYPEWFAEEVHKFLSKRHPDLNKLG